MIKKQVMPQYIDKDIVKAEIENLRKHYIEREDFDIGWNMALDKILSFLDTLEVKEIKEPIVDLEEEIENELKRTWYGEYLDTDKFKESAVYFFELGLKAQKGD